MKKHVLIAVMFLLTGCSSLNSNGMSPQEQGAAVSQCKANGLNSVVYSTDDAKVMEIRCFPVAEDIAQEVDVDNNGKKLSFFLRIISFF